MDNQKIITIKEKLAKLKELDPSYKIFGADKHQYMLNPTKTLEDIEKFEKEHHLFLPQEYKDFLIEIGNGGAGPFYGLYSLEKGIEEATAYTTSEKKDIAKPFTIDFPLNNDKTKEFIDYHNACLKEGDDDEIKYMDPIDLLTGIIFLADYGCGWRYMLVVKGEQAGKTWYTGDYISPVFIDNRQFGFLDWYESWLDTSLNELDPKPQTTQPRTDLTIINYDGWKLKEIPAEIFKNKNLKKLVLSRNELTAFPQKIFQFTKLKTLDLSMTPIIDIPDGISALKNLKKLTLNYNNIITLPDSLQKLKQLEEISMYYSYKLTKIPEIIPKIHSLKHLYFHFSPKLTEFPKNIGDLKNLQTFQCNNCPELIKLPESFVELTNLRSLNMGKTGIKELPDGFEKLINLEFLAIDIDELDLEDAVQKLKKLPKLKYLKIVNQKKYPSSFHELENIKTLVIVQNHTLYNKGNKFLPIPEEVCLIPNLEALDLTNNNQAQSLPENIGSLPFLRKLYISCTTIKQFPKSFKNIQTIEKIVGYGIPPEEKEKVAKWFPNANIWID